MRCGPGESNCSCPLLAFEQAFTSSTLKGDARSATFSLMLVSALSAGCMLVSALLQTLRLTGAAELFDLLIVVPPLLVCRLAKRLGGALPAQHRPSSRGSRGAVLQAGRTARSASLHACLGWCPRPCICLELCGERHGGLGLSAVDKDMIVLEAYGKWLEAELECFCGSMTFFCPIPIKDAI